MLRLFRDQKLSCSLSWIRWTIFAEGYLVSYYLYFVLSSIRIERLVFIMKAMLLKLRRFEESHLELQKSVVRIITLLVKQT